MSRPFLNMAARSSATAATASSRIAAAATSGPSRRTIVHSARARPPLSTRVHSPLLSPSLAAVRFYRPGFGQSREERAAAAAEAAELAANPLMRRNHDIPFQTVQLVDPATNKLDEPQSKSSILRNMDFSQEALVVVQADPPIVKIINLEEERHAKREFDARAKLQRKTSMEDKELQVPWNAAPSDMQHKINTARNILEKGDRVHLIFATRSGAGLKNKITEEQRLEIVKNFDVQLGMSAKKWKADDQTRGMWICYWQPLPSIQAEHRTKVVGVESDKKRIRDEKKEARRIKEAERLRKAEERKANGGN